MELSSNLERSSFGIVCLTRENLNSQWVAFEAGAISKNVKEGRCCCILFDGLEMRDLTGPLTLFQNITFDKDSFVRLIHNINKQLVDPIENDTIDSLFDRFWPEIESEIREVIDESSYEQSSSTKSADSETLSMLVRSTRCLEREFYAFAQDQKSVDVPPPTSLSQVKLLTELMNAGSLSREYVENKYGVFDVYHLRRRGLIEHDNDQCLIGDADLASQLIHLGPDSFTSE